MRKRPWFILTLIALAALALFALPGCNTVKGAARDAYQISDHVENFMEGGRQVSYASNDTAQNR